MQNELKKKLKEKTIDELLELVILGLQYEKLEREEKNKILI